MEGLELAKALEEARDLVGAKLSKVHQVGEVFFLRFFDHSGALALDPRGKAFHRTELRPPAPPRPPAFCQLLRLLEGQPLLALDQAGFDRVIRLRFPEADVILDLRPRSGDVFLSFHNGRTESLREGSFQGALFGDGDPVKGLGPELRRAFRTQLGRDPSPEELAAFAKELLSLPPKGFVYHTEKGATATFFPRPDLGVPKEEYPRYWEALDRVLEERVFRAVAEERIAKLRQALARKRRALLALARAEAEAMIWPSLQEKANLILTRLRDIPKNAKKTVVEGFDGTPLEIELDPTLPPQQYAQSLYKKAQKLRRTLEEIPKRRADLEGEIRSITAEIALLQEKPELAPYVVPEEGPEEKGREGRSQPRQFRIGEFTVLVGRSAKENEEILRRASPHDLWLHARDVPGAHVLIKNGGRRVPEETLIRAAQLAAWYSKARGERKVEVSYTEARYLRKPKGSPPGMVNMLRENVIVVSGEEAP
ncbi:MAG: NFACT RNA binding domain-containing protein [Candidatus Bipolaricaulota bacterium]|nr:NFACT RNA binding domain-containing protein [Candidatus Bipolaricaulota bacterium]MDW8126858.1 NFACT RNA binding domain-containing protein [Candidatus Bipolaricaulota bacterium]